MTPVEASAGRLPGEEGKIARGKLYAACVMRGHEPVIQDFIARLDMWIDDVKDNPVARRFIEIAGKERIENAERQGMLKFVARTLVRHAIEHNVALSGNAEEIQSALTTHADDDALYAMVEDMANMAAHEDFASFMRSHGVEISKRG